MNGTEYSVAPDPDTGMVMMGKFHNDQPVGVELLSREEADELARQLIEAVKTMGVGVLPGAES